MIADEREESHGVVHARACEGVDGGVRRNWWWGIILPITTVRQLIGHFSADECMQLIFAM